MLVAVSALIWTVVAQSEPHTLSVAPRTPLAVDISLAEGTTLTAQEKSQWLAYLDQTLRSTSSLRAASAESLGADPRTLEGCRANRLLRCWVAAVRSDFVFRNDGPTAPPPADEFRVTPRLLLILQVEAIPNDFQIRALVIDTDLALARYSALARQASGDERWQRQVENEIYTHAIVARLDTPIALQKARGAQVFFRNFVATTLKDTLSSLGYDQPFGQIEVGTGGMVMSVDLDDVALGQTETQPTRLVNVPPGRRFVRLSKPGCSIIEERLVVRPGETATLVQTPNCALLEAKTTPQDDGGGVIPWLWVGLGALAAAAGATAAVVAVQSSGPDFRTRFSPP